MAAYHIRDVVAASLPGSNMQLFTSDVMGLKLTNHHQL
jgi:hypothetical protein